MSNHSQPSKTRKTTKSIFCRKFAIPFYFVTTEGLDTRIPSPITQNQSDSSILVLNATMDPTAADLEKAYRDALAKFKADKTNKDLRRARTAAKKAWDEALLKECGDEGAQQLHCKDCSQMFLWTTQEQEYYQASERLWTHKPQRCRKCAESQKARRKSQHQLREELEKETNEESKIKIARKLGKAGKNMCYAFQRGRCPYGDQCKFNHDPEFAGKKKEDDDESEANNSNDESNDNNDESKKKRKVVPEVIPICKWGKNCTVKRCRYRHDVGDAQSTPSTTTTQQKEISDNKTKTDKENSMACIPVTTTTETSDAATASKKAKVMGICKWGKNCKIKRCRFQHPDDSSPSSTTEENNENIAISTDNAANESNDTENTSTKTKENAMQTKPKSKSSEKLVHKAMKKALKKAPSNKLKVKELRKLVQKKMEDMGKDEIKIVVKKTIANNKDSMALVEDGTFVKLIVQ